MKVNIYLRSISKIDDVNMEYSAQFTFREQWTDARLAYQRYADENTEVQLTLAQNHFGIGRSIERTIEWAEANTWDRAEPSFLFIL